MISSKLTLNTAKYLGKEFLPNHVSKLIFLFTVGDIDFFAAIS